MTRRGKLVLVLLTIGSVLGLVAATNAWFATVSVTEPIKFPHAALVRYLPERESRTLADLLAYGHVVSGGSVDSDGVPLALPGDKLLPGVTKSGETQIIRTSTARDYMPGETTDTVIYWTPGAKQRDLMTRGEAVSRWYNNPDFTSPIPPPTFNAADYTVTVTSTTEAKRVDGPPRQTRTITTVITAHTPKAPEKPSYWHVTTTEDVVTHEAPVPAPTETEGPWTSATETVLYADSKDQKLPTRSYFEINAKGAEESGGVVPLSIGNLSTVESRVRIGISARVVRGENQETPLTVRPSKTDAGLFYVGTTDSNNKFVELLAFRPYKGGSQEWAPVAEQKPSAWALWDLSVNGTLAVPPLPTGQTESVKYRVTDYLRVVGERPDGSEIEKEADFETSFNTLYCDNFPTIRLRLSYYVRQDKLMEWKEFYSQELGLSMSDFVN